MKVLKDKFSSYLKKEITREELAGWANQFLLSVDQKQVDKKIMGFFVLLSMSHLKKKDLGELYKDAFPKVNMEEYDYLDEELIKYYEKLNLQYD